MNESSLTKDRRKRLLIHLNPCIPSNVTPKTTISDQDGPSPNGRLQTIQPTRKIQDRDHVIGDYMTEALGVDMAPNILKEFWPDLERKVSSKHK